MKRRDRGSIFIIALAVIAGLVAVLVTLSSTQRTAIRAQINRTEALRARLVAEAGIQRAMAALAAMEPNSPTLTTDEWATLGNKGADRFVVADGSFRLEIVDASSKLNVNTVTANQLRRLPLEDEQIAAILDFREGATAPRPLGAKDEYYNNLPQPYNAKTRRFDTVDELLQVKGITPDLLFNPQENRSTFVLQEGPIDEQPVLFDLLTADSYSPLTTTTGQTKLNVNSRNVSAATLQNRLGVPPPVANLIASRLPFTRLGDVFTVPGVGPQFFAALLDNLTTASGSQVEGKLNLNTVSESVLNTIPDLSPDMVTAIVQRQTNGGFNSLGELTTIPGMNSVSVLQTTADLFDTASISFVVRVIGTVGDTSIPIEATLVIQNNQPRISQIRDYPLTDPIQRWGWEDEPTADIVLLEEDSR